MSQKYRLSFTPKGYTSKISPDVLPSVSDGVWLVPGSQNVFISEDGSVVSSKGYTLLGEAGSSGGVKWADTWMTNTNQERPMRTIFDTLQVLYDGEWLDVATGYGNDVLFCGGSWWDRNQNMDRYVFCNGTTSLFAWQGAIAEVESRVSATSLKKTNGGTPTSKEILIPTWGSYTWWYPTNAQNQVTINAIRGVDVGKNFWTEWFRAGDTISITITAIAGTYTVASVDEANNEIIVTGTFPSVSSSTTVGQGVIGTVNAYWPLAKTFAQERFTTPEFIGTATISNATPAVVSRTAHGLVAGNMVQFTTSWGLPSPLAVNTNYYVISAGLTADTFQISLTLGGAAINTTTAGSGTHTLYDGSNMKFILWGIEYTYSDGYNTDTLTGITPNLPSSIAANTPMFSSVVESTPSGGDYATGSTPDILSVSKNQVYIAQSTRNWVWISNQDDFNDYTYTVPVRINGEGGSARLDKNITAIWTNQDNTVQVSCWTDIWYPLSLASVTSNGTPGEEVRVGTPKKGTGVGANNQFSVCNTKNGIVYLSTEPAVDYLQSVFTLNQTTYPLSDPIDFDLQSYDLTDSKMIYWQKYVWLLIPREGKLLSYDMDRQFWQPPRIVSGNCLSIVDENLVIHSSTDNESWNMFDGTNDNGLPFVQRAVYSYLNMGTRTEYKVLDGYFVEAKVTPATDDVKFFCQTGYRGSISTYTGTFGSADGTPFVESPQLPSGFGGVSFGGKPFGSLFTSDDDVDYVKVRKIFPFTKNGSEFFEMQVYFECDKKDAQFKIVAHGDNMIPSCSHNSNLISN